MEAAGILVVEDERIIALDLRSKLVRLGYRVLGMAHTGGDAVRMAGELTPDIVLMDIILDGDMDGIEAARQIRLDRPVPVVFVSACNDSSTMDRAVLLGCGGFVSTPVDSRELASCIEKALAGAQGCA